MFTQLEQINNRPESMKIGVGLAFFKKQFDLPTQPVQNTYNSGRKLRAVKIRH